MDIDLERRRRSVAAGITDVEGEPAERWLETEHRDVHRLIDS